MSASVSAKLAPVLTALFTAASAPSLAASRPAVAPKVTAPEPPVAAVIAMSAAISIPIPAKVPNAKPALPINSLMVRLEKMLSSSSGCSKTKFFFISIWSL